MSEEPSPPWRPWVAPAAVAVGFVIAEVLSTIVYGIGAANGASINHPTPAMEIGGSVAFDIGFVTAAVLIAAVAGGALRRTGAAPLTVAGIAAFARRQGDAFGFRRVRWGTAITAIAIAGTAYYALTAAYANVLDLHAKDDLPSSFGLHTSHWAVAGTAVFVCAVAPMCEETFFRGLLFGSLRGLPLRVAGRDLGPWVAAVIVGILFGLAHVGSANPEYLVPLGMLGFVLCLIRWRTRSLYPGMALHSANNALAFAVQLHWSAAAAVALILGAWVVITLVAGPLGVRSPALA